jgi:HNH endonuclease
VSVAPRCRQRYSPERGPDLISHPKEKKKGKYRAPHQGAIRETRPAGAAGCSSTIGEGLMAALRIARQTWWRDYNRYLHSRRWQFSRWLTLIRDGHRCRHCGRRRRRGNPLQVHHVSYKTYNATGRSRLRDLKTLCLRCHDAQHGREGAHQRYGLVADWVVILALLYLWLAFYGC